jgi:hypothetical protein
VVAEGEQGVDVSMSLLNELDGIAVRISDPSGAQLAVENVMRGREKSRALGNQGVQCGIIQPCID